MTEDSAAFADSFGMVGQIGQYCDDLLTGTDNSWDLSDGGLWQKLCEDGRWSAVSANSVHWLAGLHPLSYDDFDPAELTR